jgi:glycosyltransferase involved in cell wall biosynthesis
LISTPVACDRKIRSFGIRMNVQEGRRPDKSGKGDARLGARRRSPLNVNPVPLLVASALWIWPKRVLRYVRFPADQRLPPRALTLWNERGDVRARFNIKSVKGRRALLRWFLFHSYRETNVPADNQERLFLAPLQRSYPGLEQKACVPITWLMAEIARREKKGYELATAEDQDALLSWIFRKGLEKYALTSLLTEQQTAVLLEKLPGNPDVPRIVKWLWQAEADLRCRFGDIDNPGLMKWLWEEGEALCSILAHPAINLAESGRRPPDGRFPFGVNLIGHARGRFGVGEDVRMAAKALESVNVPFVICDLPAGDFLGPDDNSVVHHLSEEFPYSITMFCMTGMETLRAVAQMRSKIINRRFAVGFWPWELPEWPRYLRRSYDMVDEVWASSAYTYHAFARSSPIPVRQVPMAVWVDESDALNRSDFALPEDRFLFAFAYDGLSHATRKNPQACLEAFDLAFPRGDEPVGLVIKGLRADGSPAWAALKERAKSDPRLFLITESLPRPRLFDLYRSIDCFVSLHRAEGFGRNIAECMALGKPVITTAHSGNMDFTDHSTAALVTVDMKPVLPGAYPHGAGQIWAEPDVEVAGEQLKRMFTDKAWRDGLAEKGRERVRSLYDPATVGKRWAELLRSLDHPTSRQHLEAPSIDAAAENLKGDVRLVGAYATDRPA